MLHGQNSHLEPLPTSQSSPDSLSRSDYRGNVWNRHKSPATVGLSRRPGVGTGCPTWAARQVEDLHRPIPNGLPLEGFVDRYGLDKGCLPAQLGFDSLLQLARRRFKHNRWHLARVLPVEMPPPLEERARAPGKMVTGVKWGRRGETVICASAHETLRSPAQLQFLCDPLRAAPAIWGRPNWRPLRP